MLYKGVKVEHVSINVYLGDEYKNKSSHDNQGLFMEMLREGKANLPCNFSYTCPMGAMISVYTNELAGIVSGLVERIDEKAADQIISLWNTFIGVFGENAVKFNFTLSCCIDDLGNSFDLSLSEFTQFIQKDKCLRESALLFTQNNAAYLLLEQLMKCNVTLGILGTCGCGRTSLEFGLLNSMTNEKPLYFMETTGVKEIQKDWLHHECQDLLISDFDKATDLTGVLFVDNLALDTDIQHMVMLQKQNPNATILYKSHTNESHLLVSYLRNALMTEGDYTDVQDAEKDVLSGLHITVLMVPLGYGNFRIHKITEICYDTQISEPISVDETLRNGLAQKLPSITEYTLLQYNQDKQGYEWIGEMSEELRKRLGNVH